MLHFLPSILFLIQYTSHYPFHWNYFLLLSETLPTLFQRWKKKGILSAVLKCFFVLYSLYWESQQWLKPKKPSNGYYCLYRTETWQGIWAMPSQYWALILYSFCVLYRSHLYHCIQKRVSEKVSYLWRNR